MDVILHPWYFLTTGLVEYRPPLFFREQVSLSFHSKQTPPLFFREQVSLSFHSKQTPVQHRVTLLFQLAPLIHHSPYLEDYFLCWSF
jgi:hypothetical protein